MSYSHLASEGVAELSRVIRVVADKIEHGETAGNIKDINGNTVGIFEIIEDEDEEESEQHRQISYPTYVGDLIGG